MQPLRCWSCGKAVHQQITDFKTCVKSGMEPAAALDHVGLKKYCCRRFPITTVFQPALLATRSEEAASRLPVVAAEEAPMEPTASSPR